MPAIALTGTAVTSAVAKPPSRTVGWITWARNSTVKVKSGGRWHTLPPVAGRPGYGGHPVRALHPGDELHVEHRGDVEFKLDVDGNRAYCESLSPQSRVVVMPSKAALLRFVKGTSFCGALPSNPLPMQLGTYGKLQANDDPVFKVVVGKAGSSVAVRRGALVVTGKGGPNRSVVLGRDRQTRVATGTEPTAPKTTGVTTAAEQKNLAGVQAPLPPVKDRDRPTIASLRGPHDPSSLREATFTITPSEAATLSCALDSTDLRLCSSSQSYERLPPGRHTFYVQATDAAGNIGPMATYRWTIDGSKIAFQSSRDGNFEIYTMNPDGTDITNLTRNALDDERPAWSPDGRRIVFDSNRDRKGQLSDLWAMNSDGTNLTQLTHGPAFNGNASWSPDGKKIVFESTRTGSDEIYTMNADGSNQVQLTQDVAITTDADWSRNNRIVFASTLSGNWQIYAINPDGSGRVRLTTDNDATEFGPAWSPDGSKIAFHSNRDGRFRIWIMNADGSNPSRLTASELDDYNPTWAPDGYEIAFQRQQEGDIWVIGIDTGKQSGLTDALPGDQLAPSW